MMPQTFFNDYKLFFYNEFLVDIIYKDGNEDKAFLIGRS